MNLTRVLQVAAVSGLLAALFFLVRGQWDAMIVAAALGSVAWFVRLRRELSSLLAERPRREELPDAENEK